MADGSYKGVLARADRFFHSVMQAQPQNLQCGRGCSLCCYGLFEIGAGDVPVIAEGLGKLHPMRRKAIIRRAKELMASLQHPDLRDCPPEEKEAFFDRAASVPCPSLDPSGSCLIYESRPLVCRTFGLPIREAGTYIGDICELNFTAASNAEKSAAAWDLRWEDVVGGDEEYTVPEAIVLAARINGW